MKKRSQKEHDLYLDPDLIFESFIVLESNRRAYEAAKEMANNLRGVPGRLLLLRGGVGLGKTHLIQAIGNRIDALATTDVCYISAETFFIQLIDSMRDDRVPKLCKLYQTFDLLLIDDIDWLDGKVRLVAEFIKLLEDLNNHGTAIVLTVLENKRYGPSLHSLFEQGLSVEIGSLSQDECLIVIRQKAAQLNLALAPAEIEFISDRTNGDIRKIEGALSWITFQKS